MLAKNREERWDRAYRGVNGVSIILTRRKKRKKYSLCKSAPPKNALESAVLGWLIDLVWFFVNYEEEREEKSLRKLGIRKLLILGFH